jgi:chromosome segregation ATPase
LEQQLDKMRREAVLAASREDDVKDCIVKLEQELDKMRREAVLAASREDDSIHKLAELEFKRTAQVAELEDKSDRIEDDAIQKLAKLESKCTAQVAELESKCTAQVAELRDQCDKIEVSLCVLLSFCFKTLTNSWFTLQARRHQISLRCGTYEGRYVRAENSRLQLEVSLYCYIFSSIY